MHRGGTSAIASAIHTLGAYLGPEAHLMKSRDDNPAGFFEHQLLTNLNDEILWALGGSWHEPPPLEAGWESDPRLDEFRERAQSLLREDFWAVPLWCWKDPRTALTLSFWRPLLPLPRFVICLRNPIEVARSLQARDGFSLEKSIDLWMRYMTDAVRATGHAPVLFVSYDDLVERTDDEIQTICDFIGRPLSDVTRSRAHAHIVTGGLRHHNATVPDVFRAPEVSHAASAFYVALKVSAALQRTGGTLADDWNAIAHLIAESANTAHREERRSRPVIADQQTTISDQQATIGQQDLAIADRDAVIAHQQTTLANQDVWIRYRDAIIGEQRAALEVSQAESRRLHSLIQHLESPLGAFKVAARSLLPTTAYQRLRKWGARLLPGMLRR